MEREDRQNASSTASMASRIEMWEVVSGCMSSSLLVLSFPLALAENTLSSGPQPVDRSSMRAIYWIDDLHSTRWAICTSQCEPTLPLHAESCQRGKKIIRPLHARCLKTSREWEICFPTTSLKANRNRERDGAIDDHTHHSHAPVPSYLFPVESLGIRKRILQVCWRQMQTNDAQLIFHNLNTLM